MPQHLPELQNEIQDETVTPVSSSEPVANFQQPQDKKSPKSRSAVAKNAKQYLRAAPKFFRARPALPRHSRKCQICRHPNRELIEDLYIHWHSANSILDFINSASDDDDDPDQNENNIAWPAIYRHAYALGLDEIRRRNLRFAFELLIEQAGDVTPTSASIIAAARACSCISDDGRWSDPPKHVIVTNIVTHESDAGSGNAIPRVSIGAPSTFSPRRSARPDVIPNPAAPGCVSSQNEKDADGGEGSASVLASVPPRISASDSSRTNVPPAAAPSSAGATNPQPVAAPASRQTALAGATLGSPVAGASPSATPTHPHRPANVSGEPAPPKDSRRPAPITPVRARL